MLLLMLLMMSGDITQRQDQPGIPVMSRGHRFHTKQPVVTAVDRPTVVVHKAAAGIRCIRLPDGVDPVSRVYDRIVGTPNCCHMSNARSSVGVLRCIPRMATRIPI